MRRTRWFSGGSVQNVSCMVRAGWSGTEVERVEVEPLGLDDRTLGDLPAHRDEDVGDQLGAGGDRVPGAGGHPVGRQRDVDGLLDQHPLLVLGLEHRLPLAERLVDRAAGLADPLAGLLAGLRRQRADLAVGQRQRGAVAGVVDPHLLELGEVGGGRDRSQGGVAGGLDLLGLQRGDLHGVVVGVGSGHGGSRGSGCRTSQGAGLLPRTGSRLPWSRDDAGAVDAGAAQLGCAFAWQRGAVVRLRGGRLRRPARRVRRPAAAREVRRAADLVRRRSRSASGRVGLETWREVLVICGFHAARASASSCSRCTSARGPIPATRSPRSRACRSSRASCTPRSAPTSARRGAASTCG